MLLVIDVGNTNTVLGIYEGERLVDNWRIWTERDRTSDEYGILVRNLFSSRSISSTAIEAIAVSCVVPPMLTMLMELSERYFRRKPLIVEYGVNMGMPVLTHNLGRFDHLHPRQLGSTHEERFTGNTQTGSNRSSHIFPLRGYIIKGSGGPEIHHD